MANGTRSAGYGQRLLLLAALLFGIVTMHTVGHPSGSHGTPEASGVHGMPGMHEASGMPGVHGGSVSESSAHLESGAHFVSGARDKSSALPESGAHNESSARIESTAHNKSAAHSESTAHDKSAAHNASTAPSGSTGMDPLSVCLAVLVAWGAALLVRLLLAARSPGSRPAPATVARLPHALWPNPPPTRTALARLSVLRI